MKASDEDYTGRLCQLGTPADTSGKYPVNDMPMYSFSGVAFDFWNGFANALRKRGLSDKEIAKTLASRDIRHFLDGIGEEQIENLGHKLGNKFLNL